ncbi:MAG: molybdopterin-binding protein [Spirochaetaceae bacterium]|jgi:hypothetical protein|nr:molybdopterin-binding protein [Spirochaetaceae bacterium]
MKTVLVEDSAGMVLVHDLTQIIPGVVKGARFKKGHIIRPEDIPVLHSMGKERIFVMEAQPGMVHEDEAAATLARLCMGPGVYSAPPSEGKIELFAETDGLFNADTGAIQAINELGELAVVIRRPAVYARKGDKLGAVKAIPLFIEEAKLVQARSCAEQTNDGTFKGLLSIVPFTVQNACIVVTGSEIAGGRIPDSFTPVLEAKLKLYGITVLRRFVVEDGIENITAAIADAKAALAAETSGGLILCTGGMSVDPDDNTPGAIRQSGANVVCYGAPIFPGAMFMLAYFDDGAPIAGLPGCVMFAKTTVFDVVLPRLAAGVRLTQKDFACMAIGGLCLNCSPCRFPICPFGSF